MPSGWTCMRCLVPEGLAFCLHPPTPLHPLQHVPAFYIWDSKIAWRPLPLKPNTRQCIKKQRHHFADKGPYSQSYGLSSSHVSMWELDHKEGWAPKNDAFKLWCWRRLLRVPWTERRSNQSILKEINPEYSLEGLMLKLKLQYSGYLMWRADSYHRKRSWCWERLRAKEESGRGWDGWIASPTIQWPWTWANSGRW